MKGIMTKKYLTCFLMLLCAVLMPVFCAVNIPIWLCILLSLILLGLQILFAFYLYKLTLKMVKQREKELEEAKKKAQKQTLLDTYAILGINPQYKANGSLKDIFELLKIKPEYDKDGKRILTPYELLEVNPLFTETGEEIPYIFRIKNRVKALVKASGSIPLYYIPRRRLTENEKQGVKTVPILPPEEKRETPATFAGSTKVVAKTNSNKANPKKAANNKINYGNNRVAISNAKIDKYKIGKEVKVNLDAKGKAVEGNQKKLVDFTPAKEPVTNKPQPVVEQKPTVQQKPEKEVVNTNQTKPQTPSNTTQTIINNSDIDGLSLEESADENSLNGVNIEESNDIRRIDGQKIQNITDEDSINNEALGSTIKVIIKNQKIEDVNDDINGKSL